MTLSCQQLKTEYEQLKKLKDEFVVAYEQVKEGDILTEIKKLKHNLDKAKRALDEKLIVSIERAREILGKENVLGPEEVAKTWGVKLEDVPKIPFSIQELINAKDLGQMLVLRVNRTGQGGSLSLKAMIDIIQPKWDAKGMGKLLRSDYNDYRDWNHSLGADFKTNSPQSGWALISSNLLPNSLDRTYIKQTEIIIHELRQKVFKGMKIPEIYMGAIEEFESKKEQLSQLARSAEKKKAVEKLLNLKISQLTRASVQEIIYDLAIYYDTYGTHLLSNRYTLTNTCFQSPPGLVTLGSLNFNSVFFTNSGPDDRALNVGVFLSRRS